MAIFACFWPGHHLRRLTAQKWQTRFSLYPCSNVRPLRPTQPVAFDRDRLSNFGDSWGRISVKNDVDGTTSRRLFSDPKGKENRLCFYIVLCRMNICTK